MFQIIEEEEKRRIFFYHRFLDFSSIIPTIYFKSNFFNMIAGSSIVHDTVMAIDASMLAILTSPTAMAGCLLSRGMKYLMILNMNNVTVWGRAIAVAIRPSGIQHTQNYNVTAVRLVPGLRLNKKIKSIAAMCTYIFKHIFLFLFTL